MIFNFSSHLKYLTLETEFNNEDNRENLKIILEELKKNLPLSLYYLDLHFTINPDDLKFIFDICNYHKDYAAFTKFFNAKNFRDESAPRKSSGDVAAPAASAATAPASFG